MASAALVNNAGADGFLDFSPGGGASTASAFSWLSPSRVSSLGGRDRDSRDRDRESKKENIKQLVASTVSASSGKKAGSVERKLASSVDGSGNTASASPCVVVDDACVASEADDFEFRLGDPVGGMMSADELFADGKLVPLQVSSAASSLPATSSAAPLPAVNININNNTPESVETEAPEKAQAADMTIAALSGCDPAVSISPRTPKCSSRSWKELLRFKKAAQNAKLDQLQKAVAASGPSGASQHGGASRNSSTPSGNSTTNSNNNLRSLRHFLHRNTPNKLFSSGTDGGSSALTLPLLRGDRDLDSSSSDSLSLPARLSLSSSSSSAADHEDLPRLSLDSDRPASRTNQPPRLWLSRPTTAEPSRIGRSPGRRAGDAAAPTPRCASVDSPRMNSSGKVVFQNLGRSSSSPSSIGGGNGGARNKNGRVGGVERSYSTNVRITPVLNVPVCSLKSGFGLGLFSPQKKTADRTDHHGGAGGSRSGRGGNNGGGTGGSNGNGGVNRSLA